MTGINLQAHDMDAQLAITNAVKNALAEDIGSGDVTAAIFNVDHTHNATLICRDKAVLCGQQWFMESFHQLDAAIEIKWNVNDGDLIEKNTTVCTVHGAAQPILTGERTAINFLQTLSATATLSHNYVERITGTSAQLLDTRKTIPGMRYAQKYAVKCGGGMNHRMGLYDAILIKENHIATAGSISNAVSLAKQKYPAVKLEVEVETQQQLEEAINTQADTILLDNFSLSELEAAVNINDQRKKLEASGNITLENIREIAKTGIDFISIGSITKHIRAIDFSMRFE